ncbi:MAG TPA: trypsin-like peptidase domain-containing protein, partial [Streptosporangiaceae bacterium]|nr:trypsin-like peptidase domain-containing protein [Streptosporangiaceae bacterium]
MPGTTATAPAAAQMMTGLRTTHLPCGDGPQRPSACLCRGCDPRSRYSPSREQPGRGTAWRSGHVPGRHRDGSSPGIRLWRRGGLILTGHHLMPVEPDLVQWEWRDERVLEPGTDRALWLQHPDHGRRVDVIALPLQNATGTELHPYDVTGAALPLKAGPSDGVSIVGFPYGLTGGGSFAIWTRGFVDSEPDVDLNDLPLFLIDARTRKGQSGSPVIAYSSGGVHAMAAGGIT